MWRRNAILPCFKGMRPSAEMLRSPVDVTDFYDHQLRKMILPHYILFSIRFTIVSFKSSVYNE